MMTTGLRSEPVGRVSHDERLGCAEPIRELNPRAGHAVPYSARIPRALAKKLDRLARRAHRFHRYAHHPLCGAYRGELISLGRRARVCRGCCFAALGGLGGALSATLLPDPGAALSLGALCVWIACATWAVFRSEAHASSVRTSKLATRAAPLFGWSAALVLGVRRADVAGFAFAMLSSFVLAGAALRYRMRGPNRAACRGCPEREAYGTCSGFAPILRRERAFTRVARRWLDPLYAKRVVGAGSLRRE